MRIDPNRQSVCPMFSTPLGTYKMPDPSKHEELKVAVREAMEDYKQRNQNKMTFKNHFSKNLSHYYQKNGEHLLYDNNGPIFDYFTKWLGECYSDFLIDVQGWQSTQDAFITDCWVNVTQPGGTQVVHSHANAIVSGTYYVHMEGAPGDIIFQNPASAPARPYIGTQQGKPTEFNCMQLNGEAAEGDLKLWPGNLLHYTEPTGPQSVRVSVSMNFMPKVFSAGGYYFRVTRE